MNKSTDSKEQDPGQLLEQLSQMKIELARKQKKLKKCRRSEKVKAHVKQKLEEQAQLNEQYKSQNDINKSLSSTLVTCSSPLILNQSHEDVSSHNYYTEGRHRPSENKEDTQQREECWTEQNSTSCIDDGKQWEKNTADTLKLKCNQIKDALPSHLKIESGNILTMKENKSKLVSHIKETSLKLNQNCCNSQCCSEVEKRKNYADNVKLKPITAATEAKCLNNLGNISSNVILKCPRYPNDRLLNSPGISSGELCNWETSDQKDKEEHKFLFDSLAITPSFVSTKALSGRQVTEHQDSIKPWYFDSESMNLALRLGFDSETQLPDDQSKDHIPPLGTNVSVKNIPETEALDSQSCTLQHRSVQNDVKTNVCVERQQQDQIRNASFSECRSTVKLCEKKDTARKSYFEKEINRRCVSLQTKITSHNSHGIDKKAVSGRRLEMELVESAFSKQCQLPVNNSQNCIQESPLHQKSDDVKSQTSSLSNVTSSGTLAVGRNLQSRKRPQNFSECSRRKRLKELGHLTTKTRFSNSSSDNDCNSIENTSQGLCGSNDNCFVSSPNALNCDQACNKESAEKQRNVSCLNTASNNNKSNIVIDNSLIKLTNSADSAKIKDSDSTVVDNTKDADFNSETPDSDTSNSILSQSLLQPELPLKDNFEENKKQRCEEFLSLIEHANITGIANKENTGVDDVGSGHIQTKNVTTCLDSKKTQKPNGALKEVCPQSQMNEKPHYSEGSISSSDESNQVMGEINSENQNKNGETEENYLDFTELDVIPFSQMELSESFLNDPEAYQIVRLRDSSHMRKDNIGLFIQRRSPRLASSGLLDRKDSQSVSSVSSYSSSQASSHSEQFRSNRTYKSRKSLMISSLFQFLVDEAKRNQSEEEFCLPESQYRCLIEAKCDKISQNETSKSMLKHLTDTLDLNLVHECSEELYSQDCLNDFEHSVSHQTEADKDMCLSEVTISNQNMHNRLESKCENQSIESKHSTVNHNSQNKHSPLAAQNECQVHLVQKENLCPEESKLSQSANNVLHPEENLKKTFTEPHPSTCSTDTTVAVGAMSLVPQTKQQVESGVTNDKKDLPLMNIEVNILSPDRGSVHGDPCLPAGCASSESSPETWTSSQSSDKSSQSSSGTTSTKLFTKKNTKSIRKDGLRYHSCFQTGKSEPVLSLTAGFIKSNNDKVHFVACMSEYSVSLWSSDQLSDWTNELDWLLPVGYCAKSLWLLPHQTKVALVISGLKDETVSWVLLFVYHWQTGESSRLNLHLPATRLNNSRSSLLCCPLMDQQVILCCNMASRSVVQKYSLTVNLDEITTTQSLEDTQHSLLSLSAVEGLNLALVGLSLDSHILVWNHKVGTILTEIDVTLILPSPLFLACVQAVKGYLLLIVMNRSSANPGCFLAINPQIGISKLLFNFENSKSKNEIQSFRQSVADKKIIAAVDEDGDIVLWDKYYGNILAHLPQSHSTAVHFSESLLFTGQETGCVHVMEIR